MTRDIQQMIGFWLICLGIVSVIVSVMGIEFSTKEKIVMIGMTQLFLAAIEIGTYLLVG